MGGKEAEKRLQTSGHPWLGPHCPNLTYLRKAKREEQIGSAAHGRTFDAKPSAEVQSAGQGFRVKADLLMHEFNQSSSVRHFLLRYIQALITQMAQMAACYRHHSLDQQLCRWLLLRLDRLNSNQLVATQELIANLLGVRREGVTEAALRLQRAGLIRYRRGRITVLDRNALERRVCECYAVVKEEYDRLLPAKCEAPHCRAGA